MLDYKSEFQNWVEEEKLAVCILNSVGNLMYDKGVELVFFRHHMLDVNVTKLMSFFKYAKDVVGKDVSVNDVNEMAKAISNIDFAPAKLDVGLLTSEYLASESNDMSDFLSNKLSSFICLLYTSPSPRDGLLSRMPSSA